LSYQSGLLVLLDEPCLLLIHVNGNKDIIICGKGCTMKNRLGILAFVLSIAAFLLSSTSASSRNTGAQGGCFPGTYLVVEGSGTQSLWTLSQDGGFQVTSSAERAFGFSHIQGVWKKTGARDARARGLDFNFKETPVNGGVPPSQIARLDIAMTFAEKV
jgi:hypothetical protein